MTNPIEPVRRPVAERLLPIVSARPTRALMRRLTAVAAWARFSNGPLRLGAADVTAPLDPQSRALLWYVLTETVSAIAVIGADDLPPAAALASIETLAERVRDRVATAAPRPARAHRRRRAAAHLCHGNPDPRFAAVSRALAVTRRCMVANPAGKLAIGRCWHSAAAILPAPATGWSNAAGNSAWRWGYPAWREYCRNGPCLRRY